MKGKSNGGDTIKKGFTLVELMVSVFIFLIIMVAIVQIFAQQISAYRYARVSQSDLENAQFAMNYISKTLRTATVLGEDGSDLRDPTQFNEDDFILQEIETTHKLVLYDFSQELCMRFSFHLGEQSHPYPGGSALWVESTEGIQFDEIEKCLLDTTYSSNAITKYQRLTSGDVMGTFWVAPTRYDDSTGERKTKTIGRVTMSMTVRPAKTDALYEDKKDHPIYIQTSTSLRDYPPDLSF